MDEYPRPGPSGWTFGKVLGVVLGLIGMAGFGFCTLCGLFIGFNDDLGGLWIWVLGGAVMTGLSIWLITTMIRKAREDREAGNRNNP